MFKLRRSSSCVCVCVVFSARRYVESTYLSALKTTHTQTQARKALEPQVKTLRTMRNYFFT